MKWLGILLLPPGWDASPSQGYPPPPSIMIAGTHLYNWVKRDNVEKSFFSMETTRRQRLSSNHWPPNRKSNALNTRPLCLGILLHIVLRKWVHKQICHIEFSKVLKLFRRDLNQTLEVWIAWFLQRIIRHTNTQAMHFLVKNANFEFLYFAELESGF